MSLLKWALIMFVVSLLAALFGFTDLAAASADVARVLFGVRPTAAIGMGIAGIGIGVRVVGLR